MTHLSPKEEGNRIMACAEPRRYDELCATINDGDLDYNAHLVTHLREIATARREPEPWGGKNANRNPCK